MIQNKNGFRLHRILILHLPIPSPALNPLLNTTSVTKPFLLLLVTLLPSLLLLLLFVTAFAMRRDDASDNLH